MTIWTTDFAAEPLLADLTAHGVDFVVVGTVAAVLHGSPQVTHDLDIVVASDDANERLLQSVIVPGIDVKRQALPYWRLRRRGERIEVGSFGVLVASIPDLIEMKRAAGRLKDLSDITELEAIQRLRR